MADINWNESFVSYLECCFIQDCLKQEDVRERGESWFLIAFNYDCTDLKNINKETWFPIESWKTTIQYENTAVLEKYVLIFIPWSCNRDGLMKEVPLLTLIILAFFDSFVWSIKLFQSHDFWLDNLFLMMACIYFFRQEFLNMALTREGTTDHFLSIVQ